MNVDINFKTEIKSSEFIENTKRYFLSNKFMLKDENKTALVFTRGNYLLNMVTFNPLKWRSTIKICLNNQNVSLNAVISTAGQSVTKHETEMWQKFIENYKKTIIDRIDYSEENKRRLKKTKRKNYLWILFAVITGIVIAVLRVMLR